jgi:hypothetical protein
MLSRFVRALMVALRPRFEFLLDTMTLADGRARILLRAEGIGILFAGDFVALVNGRYVASLLVPTDRRVRFVFVTVLGPFVKRVSVPARLRVRDTAPGTLARPRVRTLLATAPAIDRARMPAGMP